MMRQPIRTAGPLLLAAVLLWMRGAAAQVDTWHIGEGGINWESQADIAAAVEVSQAGVLHPSGFTASENIVASLDWQDQVPSDYRREGQARVWDNAAIKESDLAMVDGDAATSTADRFTRPGVDQTGRIFYFDFGASFPANRIVFTPSPEGRDNFIRAFELSVNDGLDFTTDDRPVYQVLRRVDINPTPRAEIEFQPQLVRFIKLRVLAPNPFEIAELEVYGEGYVPKAQYVSTFIDFDDPVNFGILRVAAELTGSTGAVAALTARNGSDTTPLVHYRVDIETQEETEVTAQEYARLVDREQGPVLYDSENWSQWSRPLSLSDTGEFELDLSSLPGPRRYFQFRIEFAGSADAFMTVRRLDFAYSAALASVGLAEVSLRDDVAPLANESVAPTGESAVFVYGALGVFDGASYAGFDGIRLVTPTEPELLELRIGDQTVEPDSVRADSRGMRVYFPSQRITPARAQPVWITFRTTPLLYNTLFRSWFLDTRGTLPQPLSPGDAGPYVGTSSLNVYGTFGQPLRLFELASAAITPNADGVNDQARITYDLVYLVEAARVDIVVYDLVGRKIATIYAGSAVAGQHEEIWAGHDPAGHLVPPGHYLCRIELRTQAGAFVRVRPLAVVY